MQNGDTHNLDGYEPEDPWYEWAIFVRNMSGLADNISSPHLQKDVDDQSHLRDQVESIAKYHIGTEERLRTPDG
jgi:hypothetical protein